MSDSLFLSPKDERLDTLEETITEVPMSRSYLFVLLSVFALFFLQLYGNDVPYAPFLSLLLLCFIVGATLYKLKRHPNR